MKQYTLIRSKWTQLKFIYTKHPQLFINLILIADVLTLELTQDLARSGTPL